MSKVKVVIWHLFGMLSVCVPSANAISGGDNARVLLSQVQILRISSGVSTFNCTGSLIAPRWVLTAQHCVADLNASAYAVQAGNLRLNQGESYLIDNIYENPDGYDAALLELKDEVPGNVLTPIGYGTGRPPVGAPIVIEGWGTTGDGSLPSVLQIATQAVTAGTTSGQVYMTPAPSIPGIPKGGDSGAGYNFFGILCGVHSAVISPDISNGPLTDVLANWITQTSGVGSVGNWPDGTPPCELPGKMQPMEIYGGAGQLAVAAYSTTRSLNGRLTPQNLYQIQRRVDNAVKDIRSVLGSSYADAATQDSFCSNTTCTITKIYDQSPFGNDLAITGPGGGAKASADVGAVADALPIMLNGHKVYGVSVTAGVGYRNNNTIGVAKNVGPPPVNKTPEGVYMVTSGKNVNNRCCFDFGNAETNTRDNNDAHMDALNFGTNCYFGPCEGSGPWVAADLENGLFQGGGNGAKNPPNPTSIPFTESFVLAMLKNDSVSTLALKGGDAQTGAMVYLYDGTLPAGYSPMQLEGGITLGTGGDNSAGGVGSFFEGIMVYGYPSDATEAAVAANIASAGYSGNSVPNNAQAPTYTGPSDSPGCGLPECGLEQPADKQANDLMGSKPGMAFHNGKIVVGFRSNDPRHELFVTSTTNGAPYPMATGYPNITMGSAPALAEFKHDLYIAFQANDSGHQLFITSSPSGTDFPTATGLPNIQMGSAPAMAEFRHQLFIGFQSDDSSHGLYITASGDGQSWSTAVGVPNVEIGSAPAMAAFRSQLFVAFRANDSSNDVWIASSEDGYHYSSKRIAGPINLQTTGPNSSPALVVSNNVLYCIYGANDQANEMLVMATTDGVNWTGPDAYLGVEMGAAGPGASVTNDGFTVGFQSNDSRNVLFTSFKQTEPLTYTGPNKTGGPQDGFASPAVQQMPYIGTKPALTSAYNNILAAYQANDGTHDLFVASTKIGENYPKSNVYPNIKLGSAPAIVGAYATAVHNDQRVFLAFQADDGTDDLFFTTSPDAGKSWPTATAHPNIKMGGAPAMVGANGKLYMAFQADDATHDLFVTTSPDDGQTWPTATAVPNVKIGSDPAIETLNGTVYVAFRADDATNRVWIASSSDGVRFTSRPLPGQMGGSSSPSLVNLDGTLYLIYRADDLAGEMLVMASTDGTNWLGPEVYPGVQIGPAGPAAAYYAFYLDAPTILKDGITVGFPSNDARNILFTTTKALH